MAVQPIDMIKVRIQIDGGSPLAVASKIVKNDGVKTLYKGLDAGILRQLSYTTARLGLFRTFSDGLKEEGKPLPLSKKAGAGLAAGGLASFLGNPADLALIRMQSDSMLPMGQRRNYNGVGDTIKKIIKEEGFFSLWRGATPTVIRAMALNMGMLASYDQAKELLITKTKFKEGYTPALMASAVSGFFAVTFSLPFDLIKTRLQKMKPDPLTGMMPYKGFVDCFRKTFATGGIRGLYVGYGTYYIRLAPHAMITMIAAENLNKFIAAACDEKKVQKPKLKDRNK
eukprot:Trichotokara_eunicae@DN4981_c0_g1_i3.p1